MATYSATPSVVLPLAGGTGNFTSDVAQFPAVLSRPGLLQLDVTAGATPTVTVNIQGSADGTTWFNVPYATQAVPGTASVAAITLTATAVTQYHLLEFAYLQLRVAFTANTNVTVNAIKVLV